MIIKREKQVKEEQNEKRYAARDYNLRGYAVGHHLVSFASRGGSDVIFTAKQH